MARYLLGISGALYESALMRVGRGKDGLPLRRERK